MVETVGAGRSVLIAGAGIAGTTLAFWLLKAGFRPTLIERAPGLRDGGYLIDFWGRGYDVAERMELLPALQAESYQINALKMVDSGGRRVGGFDASALRAVTGGRYASLPRGQLASLLYRSLDGRCETLFGDSIVGLEQDRGGVQVQFAHAAERRFDMVVGADGLHSGVRALAFGAQDRFETYLGYQVAAFEAAGYRPRDEAVYVSYASVDHQVSRVALRGDRTMVLMVFADDRTVAIGETLPEQKARLRAEFDGQGWECPAILAALDQADALYFDRMSQIRIDRWSIGRVGLVGDAAYCPSLLSGQGSALAMVGAYVLACELARRPGEPQAAMQAYERGLRRLMTDKQQAALRFARWFVPHSRWGVFFNRQITKLANLPIIGPKLLGSALSDPIDLPAWEFDPAQS